MFHYAYDGSFEGLLTTVFDIYDRKAWPHRIIGPGKDQGGLFAQTLTVVTDPAKANRVWIGLHKKLSPAGCSYLFKAFLSEKEGVEMLLFQYIRLALESPVNIEENFALDCVREIAHLNKQIFREKHRMEAFIRFQKTADHLYYATIEPDFNVLPLLQEHFEKRYADQRWLIYDTRRHAGLYYDLQTVEPVELTALPNDRSGGLPEGILEEKELAYQSLWQTYFRHVNIPERKNQKLHLRHMPKRYWRYLTEKKVL